jgi:hypothetical protein
VNIKICHISRYLTPAVKDCPVFICILCDTVIEILMYIMIISGEKLTFASKVFNLGHPTMPGTGTIFDSEIALLG